MADIGPVTGKAIFGQNRPHVAIELHALVSAGAHRTDGEQQGSQRHARKNESGPVHGTFHVTHSTRHFSLSCSGIGKKFRPIAG
jgi:hypothetical protein